METFSHYLGGVQAPGGQTTLWRMPQKTILAMNRRHHQVARVLSVEFLGKGRVCKNIVI